jgi:hypothetical protein
MMAHEDRIYTATDRPSHLFGHAASTDVAVERRAACTMSGAPTFAIVGAYFPAWMLCALLGIAGAIIVRAVFCGIGLDAILPAKLFVYASIALIAGIAMWIGWFQP